MPETGTSSPLKGLAWSRWAAGQTGDNRPVERVAFVAPRLGWGGAERVIGLLAEAFAVQGMQPLCICLESPGGIGEELASRGVPVVSLGSSRRYDIFSIVRLARLLGKFKPSVISIHDRTSLPYVVLADGLSVRRPVVFTGHGLLYQDAGTARLRHRLCSRFLSAVTAVSEEAAQIHADYLAWRREVTVIPNGVPEFCRTEEERRAIRKELQTAESTFVFLAVGNARPEKGLEDLLVAASKLRHSGLDRSFEVWVAGAVPDTPYCRYLLRQRKDLGLENAVRFLGFREHVRTMYSGADAFVLSSRSEGLPLVVLEAMMSGLPIVATRVGGVPGVLRSDGGLLVDPGMPDMLSQAMSRLLSTPALRRTLGENARKRAREEYSVGRMVTRYLETFECLVARARGGVQ